ncbi:hypothetical protein PPUN109347_36520 [Pseudomonas putida]|nr:hypothetical protein PPUN109347_36520 [Pseudomonas putida]
MSADGKTIEQSQRSSVRNQGKAQIHASRQTIARRTTWRRTKNAPATVAATRKPTHFANDRERASRAGHKGGQVSGGNFANDRQRASDAGRKGGQNSHGKGRHQ